MNSEPGRLRDVSGDGFLWFSYSNRLDNQWIQSPAGSGTSPAMVFYCFLLKIVLEADEFRARPAPGRLQRWFSIGCLLHVSYDYKGSGSFRMGNHRNTPTDTRLILVLWTENAAAILSIFAKLVQTDGTIIIETVGSRSVNDCLYSTACLNQFTK